jgi:predicted transcriptional regulator of viral defense system
MTVRTDLWEIGLNQNGYFTLDDARGRGFDETAVRMMARRNKLQLVARGVFRFPEYPTGEADPYTLALLWTGALEATLSHETVLLLRNLSDVNPAKINLTIGAQRRVRRVGGDKYLVHRAQINEADVEYWEGIRMFNVATAIRQCMETTPNYLLRQAIDQGLKGGFLKDRQARELTNALDEVYAH